jgi:hypothetical protein
MADSKTTLVNSPSKALPIRKRFKKHSEELLSKPSKASNEEKNLQILAPNTPSPESTPRLEETPSSPPPKIKPTSSNKETGKRKPARKQNEPAKVRNFFSLKYSFLRHFSIKKKEKKNKITTSSENINHIIF